MATPERPELFEAFQFRPKWWWDPVPDWIFRQLERDQIVQLATIQLELHRTMLEQQMKAVDRSLQIISGKRARSSK
jgi:hypothetical protein